MNLKKETRKENRRKFQKKIKDRDFSGNLGLAIKNSSWQLATNITAKVGSLILTIILARMLMPELYGLYGLALSTILLIGCFSDLGLTTSLVTFLSKNIDKNKSKAKAYFHQITKYKIIVLIFTGLVILFLAKWISNSFYQKPIHIALLAGIIYLPAVAFSIWFGQIFQSKNRFKPDLIRELILQVSRLVVLPLAVLFLLRTTTDNSLILFLIILLTSMCYIIAGFYQFVKAKKEHPFDRQKSSGLKVSEKKDLNRFIWPLSITAFSGLFFGHIDTLMLGHYVDSSFIAFYQSAFNLITAAATIIGFAGVAMLPIFSRLKKESLDNAFKKGTLATLAVSFLALMFTLLFAPLIVKVVYGNAYLTSLEYLKLFSLLLINIPLINLYQSYYASQKRTKIISFSLIISTILNVILNFFFIRYGLTFGMAQAVMGACVATIISRFFYLGVLMIGKRRRGIEKKELVKKKD